MLLNFPTWFCFRYGTFSIKKLWDVGKDMGVQNITVIGINNTSPYTKFARQASENGVNPQLYIVSIFISWNKTDF